VGLCGTGAATTGAVAGRPVVRAAAVTGRAATHPDGRGRRAGAV